MEPRNLNRPGYVLALLLGITALIDATNAITGMQFADFCSGVPSGLGLSCGGNGGWFIDLVTAGVSAVLVSLLLMRPHLYVYMAAVAWAVIAFVSNFAMRHSQTGLDPLATYRMAVYFVVAMIGGVVVVIEGQKWLEAERAKRPVAPVPAPGTWPPGYWPTQYGAGPSQYRPGPMPYGAPVPPQPGVPGAQWMPPAQGPGAPVAMPPYGAPVPAQAFTAPSAAPQAPAAAPVAGTPAASTAAAVSAPSPSVEVTPVNVQPIDLPPVPDAQAAQDKSGM